MGADLAADTDVWKGLIDFRRVYVEEDLGTCFYLRRAQLDLWMTGVLESPWWYKLTREPRDEGFTQVTSLKCGIYNDSIVDGTESNLKDKKMEVTMAVIEFRHEYVLLHNQFYV